MYKTAKKVLSKVINRNKLMRYEVFLRKGYGILYRGTACHCTVCNKKLRYFIPVLTNNLLCPACGSLARDRRLWLILNEGFLKSGIKILDFSPSRPLFRKLKHVQDIHYSSTDLSGNFIADHAYDITAINLPDSSLDLIICYHILEHITEDAKAMAELLRVLKPGGTALIQTPFKEGDIYEDFLITAPSEREIHFGQDDHVRVYSVAGLKVRLEKAGFEIAVKSYEQNAYNGLLAENVLIATKPS